ncbi:hypothetical protein DUI87_32209 [Hirundo rustica rustica]|uniref:Uncharacterized protein n=1 Tax=Hirundo rustica rustica TaxID=333673 RepID=A0A3M0ISM9_HIRRU|nr:hypothetical protein DUI87_32209 [Hirundo rustica rustica]
MAAASGERRQGLGMGLVMGIWERDREGRNSEQRDNMRWGLVFTSVPVKPIRGCELCSWASPGLLRPRAQRLELQPCSCLKNRSLLQAHVRSMSPA